MRSTHTTALAIGILTALPVGSLAMSNLENPSLNDVVVVHDARGIVEFVGADRIVIRHGGRDMTFTLKPSTHEIGNVKVGSHVEVRYRTQPNQRIATAVRVERSGKER